MFPRSTDWNFSYLFKHTMRLPPQKKALKGSLTQCSPLEGSPSPFPDNYLITSIPDVGSLQSAGGCQGPYSMGLLLPSLLPCILLPLQLPPLLFTLLLTHMLPSPTLNVNFMPLKRIFVSCETWSNFTKIRLASCWLIRMKRCTQCIFKLLNWKKLLRDVVLFGMLSLFNILLLC